MKMMLLRLLRRIICAEIVRIAKEKEQGRDHHHFNTDCGFVFVDELYGRRWKR